jgi:hypothetical protein
MDEQKYQRLARARANSNFAVAFTSRASLWLGEDHLLCVESNGYTETYKRFYFRDIQAITLRQTKRRLIWNWILSLLIVICLANCTLNSLLTLQLDVRTMVFFSIAVLIGIPLLGNNLLGRTCACQLRTAVQIEDLPALCRVRQTRKILEKIQPLITAAQGSITAGEISVHLRETVQPPPTQPENKPPVIS